MAYRTWNKTDKRINTERENSRRRRAKNCQEQQIYRNFKKQTKGFSNEIKSQTDCAKDTWGKKLFLINRDTEKQNIKQ